MQDMKSWIAVLICFCAMGLSYAQVVTTSPTFPVANQPVTITVDVTGTSLSGLAWDNVTNPVWIWTWIPGSTTIDAPTNINPATASQDAAKCTRISTNPDKYQITFTPTIFFNKTAAEIQRIGLKLKTRAWADNKQTDVDKFIDFTSGFNATFATPTETSFFKNTSDQFPITVNASENATLTLKINGATVATQSNTTTLTFNHIVTAPSGTVLVTCEAIAGAQSKIVSFSYTIRSATVNQPRPAGLKKGINYLADQTKVRLCLLAPGKSSAYVVGDFTNWEIQSTYQMKKDGELFWLEIGGLTAGTEYAFNYLVDESIRISDPFADKILDPDDQYIPAGTYPNLKTFPSKALTDKWYFNRASVLQTGQTPYTWTTTNYQKPVKEKLVIYELHIRDFFDTDKKNYQNLIDTISYFKRLGVNAIELMPITEFAGNDSWGYNPTFMFAPDKFYGTKNKLKEFIDKCHAQGIAVIMDMVLNQQDAPNSYLLMDFNFATFKPNATNPWFNVQATHPFSVFFDMNHESTYTKSYVDTINYYWLKEYKIDGYRYDLSKGFTQNVSVNPDNVSLWSAYDASRIAILKRMYDKIKTHTSDAYVILEHFADNAEEKELSDSGMMLWANFSGSFSQNTMGIGSNSDISGIFYKNRGWTIPGAVGYMESHDEERMMYRNLQFGTSSGSYNIKSLPTALNRVKAAATLFYSIPGPKMLWQFGELGYDVSIDQGGRTTAKPIKWDYYSNSDRKSLFNYTSLLIKAKVKYPIFNTSDATVIGGSSLQKQVILKSVPFNNNPTSTDQMNVHAIANFGVTPSEVLVSFSHTGKWYDLATNEEFNITSIPFSITLPPGAYYLFTDVSIVSPTNPITAVEGDQKFEVIIYPNPTNGILKIEAANEIIESISLTSLQGVRNLPSRLDATTWDVKQLPTGLYIVEIVSGSFSIRKKVIKY